MFGHCILLKRKLKTDIIRYYEEFVVEVIKINHDINKNCHLKKKKIFIFMTTDIVYEFKSRVTSMFYKERL